MRGTHDRPRAPWLLPGIIPAYAGNTQQGVSQRSRLRDHPRVCGEHWIVMLESLCGYGIIPAYAGNTFDDCMHIREKRDHPRVCGEHLVKQIEALRDEGSSPRMRGTPRFRDDVQTGIRIIPAYAGNTAILKSCRFGIRDHPRVCGEHKTFPYGAAPRPGSSPRMRGTLGTTLKHLLNRGIIPAYAGNTARSACSSRLSRDHPRVCGEHRLRAPWVDLPLGSSPRMRGTH